MTGLRRGEQLALRWGDIDWRSKRIRVRENIVRGRKGKSKSKRSTRSVPLADTLAGELDRHYQRSAFQGDDDLVFCRADGSPLDPSRLRKQFKDALKKAGLRSIRYHDLRHTFGTLVAAEGVAMRTLQEWLGHRDFATTLIYADYAPARGEAELVEAAFRSNELSNEASDTKANSETLSTPEQA